MLLVSGCAPGIAETAPPNNTRSRPGAETTTHTRAEKDPCPGREWNNAYEVLDSTTSVTRILLLVPSVDPHMAHESTSDTGFSELQHRLIRLGGILLGVLGLFLFFVGGALALLGIFLVWRMRK